MARRSAIRSLPVVLALLAAIGAPRAGAASFIRAEVNGDGSLDLGDPITILNFLFGGRLDAVQCHDAADANDDGSLDIGDPIFLLNFLFANGPAPMPPFPECGADPTADSIDCASFDGCLPAGNRPPQIYSDPPAVAREGERYLYAVLAEDPDGDLLVFSVTGGAAGATIDERTGLLAWTPGPDAAGTVAVTIRVEDGAGGENLQSFEIEVREGEAPPRITSAPPLAAAAGAPYRYTAAAVDPDDTVFVWTVEGPAGMAVGADGAVAPRSSTPWATRRSSSSTPRIARSRRPTERGASSGRLGMRKGGPLRGSSPTARWRVDSRIRTRARSSSRVRGCGAHGDVHPVGWDHLQGSFRSTGPLLAHRVPRRRNGVRLGRRRCAAPCHRTRRHLV